jgi:hypothetical protein
MLAYPLGEAETMLDEKLNAAESSLKNCEEDLEFLREQITVSLFLRGTCVGAILALLLTPFDLQTLEVATARVYNWDVVERRKDKADGKGEEQTKK